MRTKIHILLAKWGHFGWFSELLGAVWGLKHGFKVKIGVEVGVTWDAYEVTMLCKGYYVCVCMHGLCLSEVCIGRPQASGAPSPLMCIVLNHSHSPLWPPCLVTLGLHSYWRWFNTLKLISKQHNNKPLVPPASVSLSLLKKLGALASAFIDLPLSLFYLLFFPPLQ